MCGLDFYVSQHLLVAYGPIAGLHVSNMTTFAQSVAQSSEASTQDKTLSMTIFNDEIVSSLYFI